MSMISISIDISNSTKIKQEIDNFSSKDQQNIIEIYKQFIWQLALCEAHLYFYLNEKGIKIEDLFFVKSVGDEIWIVYELNYEKNTIELNTCVCSIIEALLEIAYKNYHITIFERTLSQEEQEDFRLQADLKSKGIPIMPKIFIDIIDRYTDFNEVRMSVFEREIPRIIHAKEKLEPDKRDEYYQKLIQRLNLGNHIGSKDGKHTVEYRTDPIGSEIDRFFRSAHESLPCIVSVGQKLIDALYLESTFNLPFNEIALLTIPTGTDATKECHNILCIREEWQLRGISNAYSGYRLINKAAIPEALFIKEELYMEFSKESRLLLNNHKII